MENALHSFSHTGLQSPEFTIFADLGNVSFDGGVEIFKHACMVGKADVVGINERPVRCGWQIIDVHFEESRCQYRALWQARQVIRESQCR